MSNAWTDSITGARMQVDRQFEDRVRNSEFSNQQWGLIMTAVEFSIDSPETPSEARLVAETGKVEQIIPELENIPSGMGAQPGGGSRSSGDGLLDRVRGLFSGSDDGVDQEKLDAATELTGEYAGELQRFLEEQGRWETVCERAASE
ncbi:MAG: hypothetical protein J07HX64_02747 [halophilic archaeon J07HX64]|jgi:hypothetical protein|nr:MAG: hypothetical protein J07HX64_02747 [halophilic archaeon J07HX64]